MSSEMFAVITFENIFIPLNPSWEYTLGYSIEELHSRNWIELVHTDDHQSALAQISKLKNDDSSICLF